MDVERDVREMGVSMRTEPRCGRDIIFRSSSHGAPWQFRGPAKDVCAPRCMRRLESLFVVGSGSLHAGVQLTGKLVEWDLVAFEYHEQVIYQIARFIADVLAVAVLACHDDLARLLDDFLE